MDQLCILSRIRSEAELAGQVICIKGSTNSSGGTGSAEKRLNSWTAAEQQGPLVQPKQLTTVPLPCAIEDINNSEMQAFFASGV